MLNHYLGEMTEIIQRRHGTIIEFIGDGILAVFGAPVESSSHTSDAVAAALEMELAMDGINRWNAERDFPMLEMGIGEPYNLYFHTKEDTPAPIAEPIPVCFHKLEEKHTQKKPVTAVLFRSGTTVRFLRHLSLSIRLIISWLQQGEDYSARLWI
ncbi:MAG: adenylate/guanylate cyclase domain-containing protein [Lachnospiraceae bacterium]|nr:adenylate/guanylate cyclase domain-containing protein [Lachnospiraceae bacterium]